MLHADWSFEWRSLKAKSKVLWCTNFKYLRFFFFSMSHLGSTRFIYEIFSTGWTVFFSGCNEDNHCNASLNVHRSQMTNMRYVLIQSSSVRLIYPLRWTMFSRPLLPFLLVLLAFLSPESLSRRAASAVWPDFQRQMSCVRRMAWLSATTELCPPYGLIFSDKWMLDAYWDTLYVCGVSQ